MAVGNLAIASSTDAADEFHRAHSCVIGAAADGAFLEIAADATDILVAGEFARNGHILNGVGGGGEFYTTEEAHIVHSGIIEIQSADGEALAIEAAGVGKAACTDGRPVPLAAIRLFRNHNRIQQSGTAGTIRFVAVVGKPEEIAGVGDLEDTRIITIGLLISIAGAAEAVIVVEAVAVDFHLCHLSAHGEGGAIDAAAIGQVAFRCTAGQDDLLAFHGVELFVVGLQIRAVFQLRGDALGELHQVVDLAAAGNVAGKRAIHIDFAVVYQVAGGAGFWAGNGELRVFRNGENLSIFQGEALAQGEVPCHLADILLEIDTPLVVHG